MTNSISVSFHGSKLFVVNHNGEPLVPMRPIVEGMGMVWSAQFVKLKQRFATCVAEIETQLPGDNQRRKVTCLPLRKLAGWLQTISPNKVKPEIRDRVIQYQNECDDVLYEYWTTGQVTRKDDKPATKSKLSTAKQLTPLRQTAERLIATGLGRIYPDIWGLVHEKFEIEHINQLRPEQISKAIDYLDTLEGEFLGKQEALPKLDTPQFNDTELMRFVSLFLWMQRARDLSYKIYPSLRDMESRLAGDFWDLSRDTTYVISMCYQALARETSHIKPGSVPGFRIEEMMERLHR
ncbi:phage antirepressor N-terminal domain-containing protein [Cedecea neteri]|uniref:phage antirepressor N-terminal domain-containing protein n=1 Tax=Cedecea neteri TaxID=158822 RepID=UPI00289360D0|nr:phage antirepressor N-terminal domain-containing protein [Cedecea neteri]WNJ77744.1 phage antirepressor N-terminal domain-containing protein [Cedecea neteri]